MLFTVGQVTVQYLVWSTYSLLIMPVRILIPTLILASITLSRMELLTVLQSLLEPLPFHLTRLRYFISLESRCLFYPHALTNHQNWKKNHTHKKITLKRIAKQRASEWLNITLCLIHGFSLLFKLNGTHVRVRWSVTRSEPVCEYRSFQSISWTSKADAF